MANNGKNPSSTNQKLSLDETQPDEMSTDTDDQEDTLPVAEETYDGVPQDSGWSWVITVCIMLNTASIIGFNRCMSVLFINFVEKFDQPATVISLSFTIHALFGAVATILVSNILMARYSVRTIAVVAAAINALTTIAISMAPSIGLFLALFTFKGMMFGALLVTPMSLLGYYFKKRRSLATSIANSGFCISYIAYPPIIEFLKVRYGLQGALLIIAGTELHLIAANLLLRSVQSYRKIYAKEQANKKLKEDLKLLPPIYKGANNELKEIHSPLTNRTPKVYPNFSRSMSYDITPAALVKFPPDSKDLTLEVDTNEFRERSKSDATDILLNKSTRKDRRGVLRSVSTLSPNTFRGSRTALAIDQIETCRSQLSIVSTTDLPYLAVTQVSEDGEMDAEKKNKGCHLPLSYFIDTSLFKTWRFRMMALFYPVAAFTNYLIIYLPPIAIKTGVSETNAALYMTLSGVMDLLTRIVSGFVADFKWVSKPKLVVASMFILTVVSHWFAIFMSSSLFVAFAILVGIFGGFRQNFLQVLLIEYVGLEKMSKAFGVITTFTTLTISVNHPVIGALLDMNGNFRAPLHYIGVMLFLAGLVLCLEPLFKKWDQQKKEKELTASKDTDVESTH